MSEPSATHATLVIERVYDAAPARVFAAWADPKQKARWFSAPSADHELDFRVGGREVNRHQRPGGAASVFDASYRDIVAEERIVYTYEMYADETLISVSVVTVELRPEGDGTRVVYTERRRFWTPTTHQRLEREARAAFSMHLAST